MNTPFERIRQIESKYDVARIKYNGESFWPFFRVIILNEILYGNNENIGAKPSHFFAKIKTAFYGFFYWFRRASYIAFSNDMERKEVNGIVEDKLLEEAMRTLSFDKFLYIESVQYRHLPATQYGDKKVSPWNLLLVIIGIVSVFTKAKKYRLDGGDVLRSIISHERISTNLIAKFSEFQAKIIVLNLLFKIYRPKLIFLTDYGYYPMTYAAKKLGIRVVEFQHGVIGNVHPFYHPLNPLNSSFCPDYLLVNGIFDKESLKHSCYVDYNNIIPIGNYYLEYLAKKNKTKNINDLLASYEKSICIPTDLYTQEHLIEFVDEVAPELPKVLFIICPRDFNNFSKSEMKIKSHNIYIEKKHSFQEIVRHCDFQTCSLSTCCLEALSLGVPNILIDDTNEATQYYGHLLDDEKTTKYAKTKEEYIHFVKNFEPESKDYLITSNAINYKPNYSENINKALNIILENS